jgi:hypothetical protein
MRLTVSQHRDTGQRDPGAGGRIDGLIAKQRKPVNSTAGVHHPRALAG